MSFWSSFISWMNPASWVGRRVHAWHYSCYGKARVEGEVLAETETVLVLDMGVGRAFVKVWKHDARPLHEELPMEVI